MGYRYSRRIRICKGVHLNVSKSGIGISLGVRGASISTGPRGTYINTGIPGTGITYRQKIGSTTYTSYNSKTLAERDYQPGSTFEFHIDNDGNESFLLIDSSGKPFTNEEFIRKIKRTSEYKEIAEKARKAKYDFNKKQNDEIVYIYKSTPQIITVEDVIKERDNTDNIKQNYYYASPFNEPQPKTTDFYNEAYSFAKATVKTRKFWKKKSLIIHATYEKMDELYKKAFEDWNNRRDTHFEKERKIKEEKDAEYKKEYEKLIAERKQTYEQVLNPSKEYLQDTVSDVLSQVELPIDFSIDYAVVGKNIELDIDLPEIEDLPQTTTSILQSGKLSIKKKTISDLNKDYATSVVGLSFFFAGLLFNISPSIENISMAGYTQRLSKKTGNIEDQYVYSVTFTRREFSKLNVKNIDPVEAIKNFEHIIDLSSKFELKTIEVEPSENRKSTSDCQEIQTEYYKVEPEKKVTEKKVIVTQLDSSSSSVIRERENHYNQQIEYVRRQQQNLEENKKFANRCLITFIVIFVLIIGCCKTCSFI